MSTEENQELLHRVEITLPGFKLERSALSREEADKELDAVLARFPDNETLKTAVKQNRLFFGLTGYYHQGVTVTVSSYRPRRPSGLVQTCPSRLLSFGPWERKEDLDTWEYRGDDLCCSFCGSLHPDRVLALIKQYGWGIISSGKPGKWYVRRPEVSNGQHGGIKYYRYHDTEEFITHLKELSTLSSLTTVNQPPTTRPL